VRLLDQTRLPQQETYVDIDDCSALAEAIRALRIRGAPALGLAGAYGLALAALRGPDDREALLSRLREAAGLLAATRPTAVNLSWALQRVLAAAEDAGDAASARDAVIREALLIHEETREADRRLSALGAELVPPGAAVLTHCNTGPLATGGYGTAFGVIRAAFQQGRVVRVYATETRPVLQGARLTMWELRRAGIPATLIADGAAGSLMRRGVVTCVIVGADRIAAGGDVANKIGTYSLAVLARENGVPFYVAAPTSTVDLSLASGDDIPIEERPPEEVTAIAGLRVSPEGVEAANPAFDVTPGRYVTAIITERGVVRQPYGETLAALLRPAGVTL